MPNRNSTQPRRSTVLGKAREILELLEANPTGLTVFEIASRVRSPVTTVVRTIADMQQRKWLRTAAARR